MARWRKPVTPRRMLLAVVYSISVVAAACTSSAADVPTPVSEASTTTFVMPELEFGRGSMPPSIPTTFPTPEQAVVGATMMDGSRNLTEVVMTYPADVSAVVSFYTTNLPALGYEVNGSEGTARSWIVTFTSAGLSGEIRLEAAAASLTTGTLLFTHK